MNGCETVVIFVDNKVSSSERVTGCAAKSFAMVETWTIAPDCLVTLAACFDAAVDEATTEDFDDETPAIAMMSCLLLRCPAVAGHGYPVLG